MKKLQVESHNDLEFVDTIELKGIKTAGRHGVLQSEREQVLPLEINIELKANLTQAAESDALADTVDYSKLHKQIVNIVSTSSRHLLERLAADLLEAIFEDRRILGARVSIAKPRRLSGATPIVTLTRRNHRAL